MHTLTSYDQYLSFVQSGQDFIVFKHSGTCSISSTACKQVEQAVSQLELDNIYRLDVLHTQELKYQIADHIHVRHESPQILIYSSGKLIAHASHGTISVGRFHQHLAGWHDTRKDENK